MLLFLGVLKNNWQLAALLVSIVTGAAFWKGEHELLLHTRTELAASTAVLREAQAAAKLQDARAAAVDKQAKDDHDLIESQLESALAAHQLTGAALTARVLQFENRRNASQVCPGSNPALGDPRHDGNAKGGAGDQHTAALIASIPATCQTVIDELGACQAWAKTVRCQNP